MVDRTMLGIATSLAGGLALLAVVACAASPAPPGGTEDGIAERATAEPSGDETLAGTGTAVAEQPTAQRPPLPRTPIQEEREVQTPTDYGNNTRVVDGDIHVWYVPTCPPVPPATWVASIILTDLRSGSHLYLNRDGSVRISPRPDYRTEEGRERFAEVLEDSSLMELMLTFPECP